MVGLQHDIKFKKVKLTLVAIVVVGSDRRLHCLFGLSRRRRLQLRSLARTATRLSALAARELELDFLVGRRYIEQRERANLSNSNNGLDNESYRVL